MIWMENIERLTMWIVFFFFVGWVLLIFVWCHSMKPKVMRELVSLWLKGNLLTHPNHFINANDDGGGNRAVERNKHFQNILPILSSRPEPFRLHPHTRTHIFEVGLLLLYIYSLICHFVTWITFSVHLDTYCANFYHESE